MHPDSFFISFSPASLSLPSFPPMIFHTQLSCLQPSCISWGSSHTSGTLRIASSSTAPAFHPVSSSLSHFSQERERMHHVTHLLQSGCIQSEHANRSISEIQPSFQGQPKPQTLFYPQQMPLPLPILLSGHQGLVLQLSRDGGGIERVCISEIQYMSIILVLWRAEMGRT